MVSERTLKCCRTDFTETERGVEFLQQNIIHK